MTKPTTIRLPKDLLAALGQRARRRNQDRASPRCLLPSLLRTVVRIYENGRNQAI